MKTIRLKKELSDKQMQKVVGQFIDNSYITKLINFDCDVYKPNGEALLKFRKKVIPMNYCKEAYIALRKAASSNDNRGLAAGPLDISKIDGRKINEKEVSDKHLYNVIKKDGTKSKTHRANKVLSGIIGYFDRYERIPYCRQTAFTEKNLDKFKMVYPIIKTVDNWYKKLMPKYYKLQRIHADKTSKDFIIKDTAFTTITVNKNFQTAVHTDRGDFKKGFGNLTVLEGGSYKGGYIVFPKFKVAVDIRNGDICMMDVHEYHGNTEIYTDNNTAYERMSLVMYYREKMINCGSAEEELKRAKKYGSKIHKELK